MKFAVLCLLGVASVDGIQLKQKNAAKHDHHDEHHGPSADDIFGMCDANHDDHLTKEEAHSCIDANIPDERKEAHDFIDKLWDHADTNADGSIDIAELEEVMKHSH